MTVFRARFRLSMQELLVGSSTLTAAPVDYDRAGDVSVNHPKLEGPTIMLRLIKLVVTMPAFVLLLSSPGGADPVSDPVGDFLPTYEGPLEGDLDVVSSEVIYRGDDFLFSATLDAPIG